MPESAPFGHRLFPSLIEAVFYFPSFFDALLVALGITTSILAILDALKVPESMGKHPGLRRISKRQSRIRQKGLKSTPGVTFNRRPVYGCFNEAKQDEVVYFHWPSLATAISSRAQAASCPKETAKTSKKQANVNYVQTCPIKRKTK